nr:MAG TPA: hypothetical protein [Caudoviricetes sp.]
MGHNVICSIGVILPNAQIVDGRLFSARLHAFYHLPHKAVFAYAPTVLAGQHSRHAIAGIVRLDNASAHFPVFRFSYGDVGTDPVHIPYHPGDAVCQFSAGSTAAQFPALSAFPDVPVPTDVPVQYALLQLERQIKHEGWYALVPRALSDAGNKVVKLL